MYKFAINRPITTLMLFLSLVIFGLFSLKIMPVNLFPNVDIPLIKITTYANGDLNYIQSKITKKIENEVSSINGVDKMMSYSYDYVSVVLVQFKLDKDIEVAANDIRDKITKARLESTPEIEKLSGDTGHIMSLFFTPKNIDKTTFMKRIDEDIKPMLQRIDGVGNVDDTGVRKPQVKIYLDPSMLNKYKITSADISKIVQSSNFKAPLGKVENSKTEILLKSDFEAITLEELGDIRIMPGVFLKDVARIEFDTEDMKSLAIMDGKEGVVLDIVKVSNANSLKTVENIMKEISAIKQICGDEIEMKIAYSKSENIQKHINQVFFDMILGLFLTIIIVFLFLRNFSTTIISALAIPTSIIGTFFIIHALGYDLNRLTLISLTLGIGIFIDDAIVVIENISKKINAGEEPLLASYNGVREIAFSVLGISLVLLCVFIPMGFMGGIVGRFFNSFALSIAGGVVVSFFVSMLLIPACAARFVNPQSGKFYHKTEPFFQWLEDTYEKILRVVVQFKAIFAFGVIVFLVFLMSLGLRLGADFMPMEDNSEFEIFIEANPEVSLIAMRDLTIDVLSQVSKDENVNYSYLLLGYNDANEAYKAKIYVHLKPVEQRTLRQADIIKKYRQNLKYAGLHFRISVLPIVDAGGINEPVQLVITGDSLENIDKISKNAVEILRKIDGVVDIKSSNEDKKNVVKISIKRELAKKLGINLVDVAQILNASFSPNIIGNFDSNNSQYDIALRFDDKYKQSLDSLKKIEIKSANNQMIMLDSFANFTIESSAAVINRFNKEMEVLITANIDNIPLDNVQKGINENIGKFLPDGYKYRFTGYIELMNDTYNAFIFTIVLSALLMYMVLASLYESFILPFIIMLTMPLAFGGVVVGLLLSGNNFSLFVMTGSILLFGMVGKNAILVVDFANRLVHQGMSVDEAVVKAGKMRLKAILMTTFAMIFAMIPLALSRGAGYEGNSPMAICIIFGLISSTILTLLIVPALFDITYKIDKWFRKFYEREEIK